MFPLSSESYLIKNRGITGSINTSPVCRFTIGQPVNSGQFWSGDKSLRGADVVSGTFLGMFIERWREESEDFGGTGGGWRGRCQSSKFRADDSLSENPESRTAHSSCS